LFLLRPPKLNIQSLQHRRATYFTVGNATTSPQIIASVVDLSSHSL
jgi:hypothetical protein